MGVNLLTGMINPKGKRIKPMEFYKDSDGKEWMVVKQMKAHTFSGILDGYLLRNLKKGKELEIFVSKSQMMNYKKS